MCHSFSAGETEAQKEGIKELTKYTERLPDYRKHNFTSQGVVQH